MPITTLRTADARLRTQFENFTAALDDDLNISAAWAVAFDWVREDELGGAGDMKIFYLILPPKPQLALTGLGTKLI